MKMWKVYWQTDGQTDMDGQTPEVRGSEKLTWAFTSGELKMFLFYTKQIISFFTQIEKSAKLRWDAEQL